MKYIMFGIYDDKNELIRKIPIIFPSILVHKEVAKALSKVNGCSSRVVSAGDISIKVLSCGGESTTLKIKSKSNDARTIARHDYLFGVDTVELPKEVDDILTKVFENKIFSGDNNGK